MNEARDLAIRHIREIEATGPLTSKELEELEEMFHLDVLAAKSRFSASEQLEFVRVYESVRHPIQQSIPQAKEPSTVDHDQAPVCPKCKSTHISANKAGFGFGKAIIGGLLVGGVGLLGGVIGSGKVRVTCIKCGHSWDAGKV